MTMAPPKSDNWVRRFVVSDPRRHKKGFTVYKVTSIVFPRTSPEAVTKVIVWKRYNDFKKLHQELKTKHQKLYLQDKFPPFAKAKFFGRFEEDVIEERRKCAITLLEFIGNHPPLFTSNVFVKFFESGYTIEDEGCDITPFTEVQTLPAVVPESSKILQPTVLHPDPSKPKNIVNTSDNQDKITKPKLMLEGEGPMLKLGGTWQFPQQADSISLSSNSSDEGTNFTDTDSTSALSGSGISSPLQSSDLQFFDPLQQTPTKQPLPSCQEANDKVIHSQVSNSWLLSLSPSNSENSRTNIIENQLMSQHEETNISSQNSKKTTSEESNHSSTSEQSEQCMWHPKPELSVQLKAQTIPPVQTEYSSSHVIRDHEIYSTPPLTAVSVVQEPASYILEAAGHVSQAQQYEDKGEFDAAFAFYKTGIACLLSGVQGDPDHKRKQIVREKTARYLLQAEKIYSQHLATKSTELPLWDPKSSKRLQSSLTELQFYKVLGVINTIMLVLNTLEDRCYIMKVLHKSPCPVYNQKRSIIPQDVPYMVKLYRYFETDSAVFLVLQHASGGKLWDHVSSYFQSLPSTPVHELTMGNVYLGKKLIQDEVNERAFQDSRNEDTSVFEDTDSVSSQDHSYLELIKDYTATAAQKWFRFGEKLCVSESSNGKSHVEYSKQNDEISNTSAHGNFYSEVQIPSTSELKEEDDNSFKLPDNIQKVPQECVNSTISNPIPDLVPNSSELLLSWKNLESLDTSDLVENAQKLLVSVNKTLINSETIASRLKSDKNTSEQDKSTEINENHMHIKSQNKDTFKNLINNSTFNKIEEKEETITLKGSSKTIVRCKSEDVPTVSRSRRERRLSSGRRRSVTTLTRTSVERRYSSDDLFEGLGRGLCGSLDRAQQLSRLESMIDRPKPRLPEANVRMWAAELLVSLSALHQWGIICRDLQPDNILLGDKGHLLLTYMCQWADVDSVVSLEAIERLHTAPEVNGIFELTPAADWWSFGALVFELLTGKSLLSCHPGGIHSHTILNIPEYISEEARSFLQELLRHNPQERLGSGVNGVQELKSHPFFKGVDWEMVLTTSISA